MVISSSPARSNDQLLVVASRWTTSRGLTRDCSEKSVRDTPVSTLPPGSGMRTQPHAHHAAFDAVPGGADVRAGPNHLRVEYNPLIPAAKAQLDAPAVND